MWPYVLLWTLVDAQICAPGREGFPMEGSALHGRKGPRRARKGLGVGEGIVGVGGGKRRENEPRPQAEKGAEAGTVMFFFFFSLPDDSPPKNNHPPCSSTPAIAQK